MDENTALRRKHHTTRQSLFSSRPYMAHYSPLPQKRVFIEVRGIQGTVYLFPNNCLAARFLGARSSPVMTSNLRIKSPLPNGLPVRACCSIKSSLKMIAEKIPLLPFNRSAGVYFICQHAGPVFLRDVFSNLFDVRKQHRHHEQYQ